ncbi:hypothetical protein H112_05968 [Trichophyton rubrum D6]|uniref:Uncharacterized protein n=3 Tax=Trichophyton rubrum TaxID=5551 RepID=A0A178ET39_TRIRU|nr:uncharacterized protein TERG_03675 [Trichophyton rubrum CBS 118892]EZF15215.1 hypothetical protein H100_05983 [Trichophyton rubrum MR850]EZF40009.1 hypothetical protein H102_05952 [Trichophyton rubrum CBS 100081]EZF50644.1 hypothetical protein H103_05978 [Trichophyton rubrum CBS 288.86]EZF61097.1 hypothetical protein H104_05965 [Trichophyton rubrum CBS 289.86]EZF82567.1 hypothetical protein H110_05974 [Trichophyton rubrum MR1448]EZF93239.1 hypothetical protein H113_06021 [Trichophyton rubr
MFSAKNIQARKAFGLRPRSSTSIAGRQTGRLSLQQYAHRSNQISHPSPSSQRSSSEQLFRPPANLNYLFDADSNENDSNGSASSEEDEDDDDAEGQDTKEPPEIVDLTGNSLETATPLEINDLSSIKSTNPLNLEPTKVGRLSQSSQRSTSSNQTRMSDDEAESWLQLRLAEEAAKKKRTIFAPLPPPSSQQPPHPPSPTPIRPTDAAWRSQSLRRKPVVWAPQSFLPVDRKHAAYLERLDAIEAAFKRLEQIGLMNERSSIEKMEFENVKAKFDAKIPLTSIEKRRLQDIQRNIERREYSWSVNKMALERNVVKKRDNSAINTSAEANVSEASISPRNPDEPKASSSRRKRPTSHAAKQPEPIQEDDQPGMEVETTDGEEDDEDPDEAQEDDAPEPVWIYHVFRTEIDAANPNPTPVYISSHLSRLRAESKMRDQISTSYGNLKERTRMEFRVTFEEDFTEQVVEFASGRTVIVRVEREIHEEPVKRKKRIKLQLIPTKIYTIIEQISATPVGDTTSEHTAPAGAQSTKYTEMPECFILRKDANAQANRLMLAHLTGHLDEAERFNLDVTGDIDMQARLYLHELDEGERLYDKKHVLPEVEDGMRKEVSIRVLEHLVRGPRN